MYRWASFIVLIVFVLVIGGLFFRILAVFFVPLFIAAILAVVFQPIYVAVLKRCNNRTRTAALVTTFIALVVAFLPFTVVISFAVAEGVAMFSQTNFDELPRRLRDYRASLGLDMPYDHDLRRVDFAIASLIRDTTAKNELIANAKIDDTIAALKELLQLLQNEPEAEKHKEQLEEVLETLSSAQKEPVIFDQQVALRSAYRKFQQFKTDLMGGPLDRTLTELVNPSDNEQREMTDKVLTWMQQHAVPAGGATIMAAVQIVMGIVIATVALYFFLVDGPKMVETFMRLSPLDDRYELELAREFGIASRAVVLATLLAAAAQGVLAAIGFLVAGVNSVFLLGLLTALFGLIPFVGSAAVWIPVSLWLYLIEERMWAAILLSVYGFAVVGQVDNLVKPLVLQGKSQLHPLLGLLSVLGGVQALGPIGILVGPMVVIFLQTLLNILHREMGQLERRRASKAAAK